MKTCTGMLRPDHNWNCLSQKSRSHSHAKGHFLHLTPTPRYAGSQFSIVRGESGVSTLITAQLMSFKKAGGVTHCIRGRDIWLRQIHPQAPWGAWHFQDTENKLPLRREYAFSVGKKIKNKKKTERTGEGQYVLTSGWKPTIREISVLSEKVKASKCPLVHRQIQGTARTQRKPQSWPNRAYWI